MKEKERVCYSYMGCHSLFVMLYYPCWERIGPQKDKKMHITALSKDRDVHKLERLIPIMDSIVTHPIEHDNQRLLTSQQLAEIYGTTVQYITNNFNRNKDRYVLGKHYFLLEGEDLKQFKTTNQNDLALKGVNKLYLWTQKGALHHAKSLGTDEAWEMYERLVDEYFVLLKQVSTEPQIPQRTGMLNNLYLERLRLFGQKSRIPSGYFAIYIEAALPFSLFEERGYTLPERAVPDGSIGLCWCSYARDILHLDMSLIKKWPHFYPDNRGMQHANIYPIAWLPEYRKWFDEVYLPEKFPSYLTNRFKASREEINHALEGFHVQKRIE